MAVISITLLVNHHIGATRRAEDRLQAFYAAEAGIQQVTDWFNRGFNTWLEPRLPENLDGPRTNDIVLYGWQDGRFPDTTFQGLFAPDPISGRFASDSGQSIFAARLEAAGLEYLEVDQQYPNYVYNVMDSGRHLRGRIITLLIEPPVTTGTEPDPRGTVARVTAVGTSITGVRSTIEVRIFDNRIRDLAIPAAIMSRSAASSNGQFNIHWGEVWTRANLELTNLITRFPTQTQDPWFYARAQGHLVYPTGTYADGRYRTGESLVPIESSAPNYYLPYLEASLDNQIHRSYYGRENLSQHASNLPWPEYDYNTIKMLAMRMGWPIYRTTSTGMLLVPNATTGALEEKTFEQVFNDNIDPDSIDGDAFPPMYFIDTVDGNAPRADGSNMTTLRVTGSGPFFHGYFFVAANMYFGGAGNSPTLNSPERPDGTTGSSIRNCRLSGLLYTYGTGEYQGQGDVYGAVYSERGFLGGGGWDIYFDYRLQNPIRTRIQSTVRVRLWNTY